MKALPDDRATESISELNDRITNEQFTQDVPIWENKIYRERPMITKSRRPGEPVPTLVPPVLLGLGALDTRRLKWISQRMAESGSS